MSIYYMRLTPQCKKNLGMVILIFAILIITMGVFFLHYLNISEERIRLLEERNSVLHMNNKVLTDHDQLYQQCEQIKNICKEDHPEIQALAVIETS